MGTLQEHLETVPVDSPEAETHRVVTVARGAGCGKSARLGSVRGVSDATRITAPTSIAVWPLAPKKAMGTATVTV